MDELLSHHTDGAPDARFADGEQRLWSQFAAATTVEAFCQSWLAIQCRQIDGVKGGAVLARDRADAPSFSPIAVWPDVRRNMSHLGAAAEQAITQRRGVLREDLGEGGSVRRFDVAYPVEVGDLLCAVAVLEISPRPERELQDALRRLHWGIAWLIDLFRRLQTERDHAVNERVITALDCVASTLDARGYRHAASTFVTEFAARLHCDRVSLGFCRGRHVRVEALSHSAHFKQESNLLRDIGAAMDEAIDQAAAIVYPALAAAPQMTVARAAQALNERHAPTGVACIPFNVRGKWAGAVTLERTAGEPFNRADIELCQATVALVGPVLDAARLNDRPLPAQVFDSMRAVLEKFFGAGHLAWKLIGVLVLGVVFALSVTTGGYRVTADAATEGSIQTAIVAPFGSYVAEAPVRAGDIVEAGQTIALLDDRDLQLERIKWGSQRDQIARQLREAKAQRELAQVRILDAQAGQTRAQLELVTEQLKRTRIVAPYAGLVISGDLSQSLGAPVERGDVLFEIAPLTSYRLVLQVDDRDISQVAVDQTGTLTRSALPEPPLPFVVRRITPVATAEEGRNFFRVEADLTADTTRVRPGMNGVAKIDIAERRLIWIWTHRLFEWLRLWSWTWLP